MENIKALLTVPYHPENFKKFSVNFLKNVETVPLQENKTIPSSFKNTIESYTIFGKYRDDNGNNIIVLSVKIKDNSSAQKAQRQFVSYLLANEFLDYSAALVAYYDNIRKNWKLSFVTIEYTFGENGVELKFKPAKRFSFLVGEDEPTKTYVQQLNPIYSSNEKPTLESLTEAFSVSRLSKDFYEDYKNKFFELYDYLVDNTVFVKEARKLGYTSNDGVKRFTTTFCKKVLGQIMFLHFIQKKGWLGVSSSWGDGDKQYLIHSTTSFDGDNYFNDFLEPLFYKALNTKRDNDTYLGKKIPFLNGGLFHPIENYDWENTNFEIPNSYWFNSKENGLLNVLSQYNFTVDEADPEEQEVAIDPEMLGKIFESLLDTNDRSSLGAFYTPREIVHFMCEEALAARISKVLGLDYYSMLNYVRYGDALKETEFIKEFAEDIDGYVSKLTIIDPAVGSGAFLVGMLNQIVKLRMNLLSYTDKKLDKYNIKLNAIQNSLYGVDIEFDAVEIAKLRLWLSLVVDQETNGNNPKPLPNLNFHLRVGNSLVDVYEGIKLWNVRWRDSKKQVKTNNQMNLFNVDTVAMIMSRLKEAKAKFFSTSDENEKRTLSAKIEREQIELIRSELVAQGKFDIFEKLEDMLKKKTKPFFIWELEFEEVFENGGFDIVIANPPYVGEDDNKDIFAPIKKASLGVRFYHGKMDLFYFFFHLALDIVKENGILCFISTNYYVTADGALNLRKDLYNRADFLQIINFNDFRIFDSAKGQHNMITILSKKDKDIKNKCRIIDINSEGCLSNRSDIMNNIINSQDNDEMNVFFKENNSVFYGEKKYIINRKKYKTGSVDERIINTLERIDKKLSDFAIISQGVVPGAIKNTKKYKDSNPKKTVLNQGIFVLDKTNNEDLKLITSLDDNEKRLLKPYFKNSDIFKYGANNDTSKFLLYIDSNGITPKDAPHIYDHLLLFDSFLKERLIRHNEHYHWTSLHRERDINIFLGNKILVPYRANSNIFGYTENPWYFSTDCYSIKLKNGRNHDDLLYILGILNSDVYKIWFKNRGKVKGSIFEFMPTMLNETPIIQMKEEDRVALIANVKRILDSILLNVESMSEYKDIDKIIMKYID